MRYKPYPKYKKSGVAWLGEVPEGWIVTKIKNMLSTPITDGPHETPIFLDEGIPFVSAEAISKGFINFNKIRGHISLLDNKKYSQKYSPKLHDVFMIKSGATTGVTAIVEDRIDFNIWSPLAVFRTNQKLNPFYLLNYLRSSNFQTAVELYWSYGTQQNIGMNVLENLYISVPSIQEQRAISTYLDQKTQKIDTLIEKQQTLIKLLKEKRQALISHAVTKGLDDTVEMKDSGVAWLGAVPLDWKISKLRFIFSFNKGLTITKANLREKGIPCVNYGEIHSKYGFEVSAEKHELKCVDPEYLTTSKSSLLSKGDFVFADTSEDIEGAGNFTHLSGETQVFAGYHTIIARQIYKHNFRFLAYLIDSEAFRMQVRLSVKGVKVFSVTQLILKNCIVWLPEVEEQKNIAQYLDQKTKQIDTLISKSTQAIELLKERRTALISAVVTGKVDVRNK